MTQRIPPHLPTVLMLGIISQIAQVLLMREFLVVFHGNELSIGLILAAWLVWVGIGSHLGAALIERIDRPRFFLTLSTVGLLLGLPLTILLVRGLRGLLSVFPGAYLSLADMALSCFVLTAPVSLLLGAQFVLLARIWRAGPRSEDISGAEKTYIGEATGNLLGGILFTFVLVHYLTPLHSAVLAAGVMLAAAAGAVRGGRPSRFRASVRPSGILVVALVLALLSFPLLGQLDDWAYRMQWDHFAPQHPLIETHHSKHGAISVARRGDQYSFYQSGHLVFSTAGPEAAVPGLEEEEAVNFAHLVMVQHPDPGRVLLIGGGLRGTLSEMLEHGVERIDYIELDDALTRAALPYVSPRTRAALDDPRVRLIHADGRLHVKTTQKQYDLVVVDAPDPFTAAMNRYYTAEFFAEVRNILRPGGVLATGATSTPDLRGTAVANRNATIYHTLDEVFAHVLPAGDRFLFFFASEAGEHISLSPAVLKERYRNREIETADFSPARYPTLLEETQLRRVNWVVRTHGRSPLAHLRGPGLPPPFPGTLEQQREMEAELPPVNRQFFVNSDLKPIGYYYTLMLWESLTRGEHRLSLGRLLSVQRWWILPLALIPLLVALALRAHPSGTRRGPAAHFAILFAAFTTGLSTMSLQIALLFSFQGIYGFVYEMIGLITAMFMGGLAAGALLTHRRVRNKADVRLLTAMQLVMAGLAGGIAVILPAASTIPLPGVVFGLFSVLTFGAGMINGIDFPLTVSCYMSLQRRAEKSTGAIYGMELFGACAGAILASTVVAPILGIAACCLLAAIASGAASAVLFFTGGWTRRGAHQRR